MTARAAVLAAIVFSVAAAARGAEPEPAQLGSLCEASAVRVVPCPAARDASACLLVADNEVEDNLYLYSIRADGSLADETPIPFAPIEATEKAPKLADIEAIEVDGERIHVVASHARKSWKDEDPTDSKKRCARDGGRLVIFAGTWAPATSMKSLAGAVTKTKRKRWRNLLHAECASALFRLAAGDAKGRALAAAACERFAANDGAANQRQEACEAGFNIEGAAAIPGANGQRRLWLGLRAPTLDGKALLLRVQPGDTMRFDGIAAIDLGERRGVRDMVWARGRLWLLGGPTADTTGIEFALEAVELASLESGAQLEAKRVRSAPAQAEGLALFAGAQRAAIVTDGDEGDAPGAACKLPSTFFSVPLE